MFRSRSNCPFSTLVACAAALFLLNVLPAFAQAPIDSDGDGVDWPSDCNDAEGATHPGASEACNGVDDDCNGAMDDGPGCVRTCRQPEKDTAEARITTGAGNPFSPQVVSAGPGYGVVWQDDRDGVFEIFFARLDAGGSVMGSDRHVSDSDGFFSGGPALVWTGSQYGVAWVDQRDGSGSEIYFTRLDPAGSKLGPDVRVTSDAALSQSPRLTWNGNEFALVWEDQRDGHAEIYFTRLDRQGQKIGGDVRVTSSAAGSQEPDFAWNGSGYAVAWYRSEGGASFTRLDAAGTRLGPDILESPASVGMVNLVWNGTGYGMSWVAVPDDDLAQDTEIYAARLDASGIRIGPEVRLTNDGEFQFPAGLAWSGQDFAIASYDYTSDNVRVFVRTMSAGGIPGATIPVAETPTGALDPAIAWTGHGFALAWEDLRVGTPHQQDIFFGTVSCCSGDRDADHVGDLCDLDDGFIAIDYRDSTTIAWQPESGLDSFDLYRGRVSLLHDGDHDGAADDYAACRLLQGSPSISFVDPAAPPSRDAYFYIAAGTGPGGPIGLGNASSGAARTVANPQLCP